MNTKMKTATLAVNQTIGHQPLLAKLPNGERQPPRNAVVASAETVTRLMYSARKKKANLIELYSVWKPPTISPSPSAMSKGARLTSPTMLIR